MKHEKIIRREDKSRIKIKVSFFSDFRGNSYLCSVLTCPKGKRKFVNAVVTDDWNRRKLSMNEREVYDHRQQLKYVSEQEILEAKLELWEKLKPTI